LNFVRHHQVFIVVSAIVALVAYAVVLLSTSRETATTVGTAYLVVLMTVVVVDSLAHRNQGPRA
jgi:hypothetical protein